MLEEGETQADLGDYSMIISDKEVVAALEEGLKEAQGLLRILNMAPSATYTRDLREWYDCPWKVERLYKKQLAYTPTSKPTLGEDVDMKVLQNQMGVQSSAKIEEVSGPILADTLQPIEVCSDDDDVLPLLE